MKKNFKKWKNALIGVSAGLIATASTVTPIVVTMSSCGNSGKYLDDIDRQYDVSSVTYDRMKDDLRSLYKKKMEWLPAADVEENMKLLEVTLSNFDDIRDESSDMVSGYKGANDDEPNREFYNYTTLTSALIKYADEQLDISLSRHTSATWQDLQDSYQGFRDSNEIYMRNSEMPADQIQEVLHESDVTYGNIRNELQQKYGDDALSGLIYGLPKLLSCFESINLETASLTASNKLKELFEKFTFVFKERNDNLNRYDVILPTLQDNIGLPIGDDLMLLLFDCVEQKSGFPFTYSSQMIPGYTITPVLHEILPDPYRNVYEISIDWSVINNKLRDKYKDDAEKIELLTGHLYGANPTLAKGEDLPPGTTVAQALKQCEHEYMKYQLYPTAAYEAQQIGVAYFSGLHPEEGQIYLKWNDVAQSPDNKYEYFFTGIKEGESTGTLDLDTLGKSGLLISNNNVYYENVSKVLDRVGPDAENVDEDTLTLAEQFIRYCDVTSTVKVVDSKAHLITNDLSISYRNTVNKDNYERYYTELPTYHNDHYLVSPEFFKQANRTFNDAYDWVIGYKDNVIQKIYSKADDFYCSIACSIVKTAGYTAYYMFYLINPIPIPDPESHGFVLSMPSYAAAIAICIVEAVLLGTWIYLTDDMLITPLKEAAKRNEQFRKEDVFQTLINKVMDDTVWFSLGGKEGEKDYDDKYKKFASADFEEVCRPLYQFYSNFHQQDITKQFVERVNHYKIDSVTISSIVDPLLAPTGLLDWISVGYMLVELVFATVLGPTLHIGIGFASLKRFWLWLCPVLQGGAISFAISGIEYAISHTIKKFITGYF